MILYTERLILRPWNEQDAADLYTYARDPRIGPPAGWMPHKDASESSQIIRTFFAAPETYAVCLRETNRAVGCIGLKMGEATELTDSAEEAEIGYWIGVPYWGKGYIPEAVREIQRHAFEDLGMRCLWCGYYSGNEQSHRVMEKSGFRPAYTREGVFVQPVGEIRTEHIMVLNKTEWRD